MPTDSVRLRPRFGETDGESVICDQRLGLPAVQTLPSIFSKDNLRECYLNIKKDFNRFKRRALQKKKENFQFGHIELNTLDF
jgi:hypothetical protein